MDTMRRLGELLGERDMTLYGLSQECGISYSTLKNAVARHGQLSLDSIERICARLGIPLYEFFMTDEDWDGIEAYAIRRLKRHDRQTGCTDDKPGESICSRRG